MFTCTNDLRITKEWMEAVEGVMSLVTMMNEERIRYTTYLFHMDARVW